MRTTLAISQARSRLGRLADQAVKGNPAYPKRGEHLLRLERVQGRDSPTPAWILQFR